jgi:outer membrane protein G
MKKVFTLVLVLVAGFANAQAFKGKGDFKAQIGASIQSKANGIFVSGDYGIGENMSVGVSTTYILGISGGGKLSDVKFKDKFDMKARFNANIGNVLKIDDNLDVYPGLSLGLKNFGAHLGVRYFFTNGFGVFTEFGVPLAKYDAKSNDANNQFMANFGVSFNL